MLSRLFNNEYDRVANEVAKEVVNNALVVSGKKKENREHMGWIDGAEPMLVKDELNNLLPP